MADSCRAGQRGAIARPLGTIMLGMVWLAALTGLGRPSEVVPDLAGPWMRTGNAFDFAPPTA